MPIGCSIFQAVLKSQPRGEYISSLKASQMFTAECPMMHTGKTSVLPHAQVYTPPSHEQILFRFPMRCSDLICLPSAGSSCRDDDRCQRHAAHTRRCLLLIPLTSCRSTTPPSPRAKMTRGNSHAAKLSLKRVNARLSPQPQF